MSAEALAKGSIKPLGHKNYGSIPHLPGSRLGPGDHHCAPGQATICLLQARDKHDVIVVQEKVDGSNVGVALKDGHVLAHGRAGYLASTSKYEQHRLFAAWVQEREDRFRSVLTDGERLCGEWLAQAHGTRYALTHEPFVAFDIMRGQERTPWLQVADRLACVFVTPATVSIGPPVSIERAMEMIGPLGHHGATEQVEGAVWRVEHRGKVDFLAKYVRPDKRDGCHLPEETGGAPIWNWRP